MDAQTGIERIWQFTKAIEQAAAVGEWQQAARLADERSPLLMSLGAHQPPVVIARLKEIHAIDSRITMAAQTAQREIGQEYQASMRAARNVNQYQRVAQF